MTEMENGEIQNFNNSAEVPASNSNNENLSNNEKTFRQSELNEIVGRARQEAVERYKRETSRSSHENSQHATHPVNSQHRQYNANYVNPEPPANVISQDEIRRLASEEIQRSRDEWNQEAQRSAQEQEAQRIASEFFTKVNAGKSKLQDFDTVMADVDLRAIPYHVQLANMVDNTAEVMYELAKNPAKIGAIQNLIDIDLRAGKSPKLAMAEMRKLSQSIKNNESATNFRSPNEPLSQVRPSNAGTDNRGALTVSDYRRKYKV